MEILLITTSWLNCPLCSHERYTKFYSEVAKWTSNRGSRWDACVSVTGTDAQGSLFARCTEPRNPATSEYLSGLIISFTEKCSHCVMLNSDLTNVLTLIKVTNLKMSRHVFNYFSWHGSPPHHTHYPCFYVNYNTVLILRRRKIRYLNLCSKHIHLQWVVNIPLYFKGNTPGLYSTINLLIFSFIHFLSLSSFFWMLSGK